MVGFTTAILNVQLALARRPSFAFLAITTHRTHPTVQHFWGTINKLPSTLALRVTVSVVLDHVVDRHARVILVDVHELRERNRVRRVLVVHGFESHTEATRP